MPLLKTSSYRHVPHLFNGHLETVVPSMFRKVKGVAYTRERLTLPDADFIDIDWLTHGNDKLVIISHGLEGSSNRHYVKGMAKYFHTNGWDVLAWNCRSCSGEINLAARMYHHAATDDLEQIVLYATKKGYKTIALTGFSMGRSLSLKYIGENLLTLPEAVKACAVFSVPCNLGASAEALDNPNMAFYRKRFLKKLGIKIQQKAKQFPDKVKHEGFEKIKYFREFDNIYTAPLHGFKNADDFYNKASALHYIPEIKIPTLIVNAVNDPFLPEACSPIEVASIHQYVHLKRPLRGGHVGFSLFNKEENWMELRALEFIKEVI